VTSLLFQPFAFGAGVLFVNAMTGEVLSILMPVAETGELTCPTKSVHVPEGDVCPAPSVDTVTGALQNAIPDPASFPVKVTVTSVLFHPLAFADGLTLAVAVGAVLSILIPV
jgi:hypothetical protein